MKALEPVKRQEFDYALDVAPELVLKEGRFIDFLRIENSDSGKAAERLGQYWKNRKILFGDRWLLPLTQTGNGALNLEDISILRTGFMVVFSRTVSQGPLVLLDWSRLSKPAGDCAVRVAYYYSLLYAEEVAQAGGIDIMTVVTSDKRPPVVIEQDGWDKVLSGLPIRIKQFLVVQNHEEGRERYLDSLAFQVSRTLMYNTKGIPNEHIASDSTEGLLRLLHQRGVILEHIPQRLGGLYDYSSLSDFIRIRTSEEDKISGEQLRANAPAQAYQVVSQIKRDPEESKEAFSRRRNAVYSRRVFQRRQNDLVALQQQRDYLKTQNTALERDNSRLEMLLAQAEAALQVLENQSSLDTKPPGNLKKEH